MSLWVLGISETMGMAAVALLGYLVGRWSGAKRSNAAHCDREREVGRAAQVATRLERIADALRQSLASHHAQVLQFKRKLRQVRESPGEQSWQVLCDEAELVLEPTMHLASQLSQAYDQLRQQSQELASFTAGRSDSLTGVATAKALEEQVTFHLRCQQSHHHAFSIALLTVDSMAGSGQTNLVTDRTLQNVAHLLQRSVRGNDFVARYGAEEFAVLLPNTGLQGANQFGARIRILVEDHLGILLSVGLAESVPEDEARLLLGRADSALYSARAEGGNVQFSHTGTSIRQFPEVVSAANSPPDSSEEKRNVEPVALLDRVEDSLDEIAEELVEVGA